MQHQSDVPVPAPQRGGDPAGGQIHPQIQGRGDGGHRGESAAALPPDCAVPGRGEHPLPGASFSPYPPPPFPGATIPPGGPPAARPIVPAAAKRGRGGGGGGAPRGTRSPPAGLRLPPHPSTPSPGPAGHPWGEPRPR